MVLIKGKELSKALQKEHIENLAISPDSDFEMTKVRKGLWLVAEKNSGEKTIGFSTETQADAKIFSLLREKKLSERVEGKFEKFLKQEETARLKELLKEGKVIAFKLSEKYKKPVYKIPEKKIQVVPARALVEKPLDQYCLEKDGLLVCTDKAKAQKLSFELQDSVKKGEIIGIKSFDGNYYVIETGLLQKYKRPVAEAIEAQKNASIEQVASSLNISKILAKIICEFLKEDGEIIEKRTGHYQYVK